MADDRGGQTESWRHAQPAHAWPLVGRRWLQAVALTLLAGVLGLVSAPYLLAAQASNLPFNSAGAGLSAAAPFSTSTGAVVSAASGILPLGGVTVTLPVNVSNVTNLGAASVLVGYDPTKVAPTACKRGSAFDLGLCNLKVDRNGDGAWDAVWFNALVIHGVSVPAGALLALAEITWQVTGTVQVGATTILSVTVESFDDSEGIPLPVSAQNGEIVFFAAPTATASPTASKTATPTSTATATASPPATVTATASPPATATATATATALPPATATATATASPATISTATSTFTPTATATVTPAPTVTPTELAGATQSSFIYLPVTSN